MAVLAIVMVVVVVVERSSAGFVKPKPSICLCSHRQ
jgi:hypothetical protein